MKLATIVLGVFGLSALMGCATADPLNTFAGRSETPARAVPVNEPGPAAETVRVEVNNDGPLSMAACVDLALSNQPATRAAWLATRSAAASVGEARAAWLPTAALDGSAGLNGDLTGDSGFGASARLTIGYLLFDGGARKGRVDAARARLDEADFRHQEALLDVAVATESAFYALQGALWFQGVVGDLVADATYQHELAAARFQVGLVRKVDVAQAAARMAQVKVLVTEAQAAVQRAGGELARSMGLDPRTELTVAPLDETAPNESVASIDALLEQAVRERPELGAARARVRESMAAHRIARAGHMPAVSADAAVGAATDSRSGESAPWNAGVSISVPLFSGFETSYAVRRTSFDEEQARTELEGLVTDVQFAVWSAYVRLNEALSTFEAAQAVVTAATEAVRLAEANYKAGLGTIGELLDAQAELASAKLLVVQARIDWSQYLATLHRAVGTSLSASGTRSSVVR